MALENILVIGKDEKTQQLARPFTKQLFAADDTKDLWQTIASVEPNLILIDLSIPHEQLCSFLENKKKRAVETPIIIVGSDEPDNSKQLIQLGAYDYLKGDTDHKRLGLLIDKIRHEGTNSDPLIGKFFSEHCPDAVSIVGTSPSTAKTLKMIKLVAQSSCNPVLIIGETGTGKELAARAVHVLRHGSYKKFVAINCAALTANLLESELFGHAKGSFTSAEREKTGLLELADTGTIFLDEISEMPCDLQAKLLRVLQEKNFRKVGGIKDITCNATIIASSNRNLFKDVQNNKFRKDLYYRLTICPITLEPLRAEQRKEDIPLLAEYFIKNSTICPEKQGKIKGMTKLAIQNLYAHNWPGNIRELRNVIDRAILLETTDKIGTKNLFVHHDDLTEVSCQMTTPVRKDFSLETAEKELIAKALKEAGWQKTRAAALLGITRATLYAKVKQYKIQEPEKTTAPAVV